MAPLLPILFRRAALFMLGAAAGAVVRDVSRDKVDAALDDLKQGALGIVEDIQRDIKRDKGPVNHYKAGLEPDKRKK